MARVTVEDCIDKVDNRFDLVLLASHRARQISQGAMITVDRDNDKNPVVALREIADETLSPGDLKEDLIHSLQKHVEVDEPEPDPASLLATEEAPEATSSNWRRAADPRGRACFLRSDVRRGASGRHRRSRSAGKKRRLLIEFERRKRFHETRRPAGWRVFYFDEATALTG